MSYTCIQNYSTVEILNTVLPFFLIVIPSKTNNLNGLLVLDKNINDHFSGTILVHRVLVKL